MEYVGLFFQFESEYYDRNKLERMVERATELIEKNHRNVNIQYKRINIHPVRAIFSDVIEFIDMASFCVFELSDNNPNVLFELGYAVGKNKGIVIIRDETSKNPIPSDLTGLYLLKYNKDSKPLEKLTLTLSEYLDDYFKQYVLKKFKNALRNIWSFEKSEAISVISANLKQRYHMAPSSANALVEVIITIKDIYPNIKIERFYSMNFLNNKKFNTDLILIGGPIANEITKEILDLIEFPWEYVRKEGKPILQNNITKKIKKSEFDGEGVVIKDFGVFFKIPNRFAANKNTIIMTGISSYGVLGCAKEFSIEGEHTRLNCKRINDSMNSGKYFAVLTECEIVNGRIISKLISDEFYTYNPNKQTWNQQNLVIYNSYFNRRLP